jgi:hypothetical protein
VAFGYRAQRDVLDTKTCTRFHLVKLSSELSTVSTSGKGDVNSICIAVISNSRNPRRSSTAPSPGEDNHSEFGIVAEPAIADKVFKSVEQVRF